MLFSPPFHDPVRMLVEHGEKFEVNSPMFDDDPSQ
jgi:hypothetical protein